MKNTAAVCDCNTVHETAVEKAIANMPVTDEVASLTDWFKVLGDSTRVRILCALDQTELCVCDLAVTLNMTKSAVSHQLSTLRQAGFVQCRRDGKNVYYRLDDEHVNAVLELSLTHVRHKHA